MLEFVPAVMFVLSGCIAAGDGLAEPTNGPHTAIDDLDVHIDVRRVSRISLESHTVGERASSHATASFYDEYPAPVTVTVIWEGSCRIAHIRRITDYFVREWYDLGTLRVSGGARELTLAAARAPGGPGYPAQSSDAPLFLGGETLTVNAVRAGTVALATEIVAPAPVIMTDPLYPPDNLLMVNRYADLGVSWRGAPAGELVVQLSAITQPGESSVEVECFFPVEDGWGMISLWVFQEIPEDAAIKLTAEVRSTAWLELPHWGDIELRASTRARVPSGAMYAASMGFWPFPER